MVKAVKTILATVAFAGAVVAATPVGASVVEHADGVAQPAPTRYIVINAHVVAQPVTTRYIVIN